MGRRPVCSGALKPGATNWPQPRKAERFVESHRRYLSPANTREAAGRDTEFLLPMAPRGDRWRRRSALVAAVIFFAAMSWSFVRRGAESEFNVCYLRAATRMQARQAIHRDEPVAYAYPPAMAMLVMPLAKLPAPAALGAWYLINVIAVSAVAAGSWRLIGGSSILRIEGRWLAVFWLAVLLSFRFVSAPLENQQFDAVIAALVVVGCLCLRGERPLAGALWLGAAAAMKCTPLLFAPYLVWRGRLKAACLMTLAAVALNRAPDFVWPQASGQSYLGDWCGMYLAKVGRSAPGVWDSDLVLNQSLSGLVNRFAQAGLPWSIDRLPRATAALAPETVAAIRWLTYGLSLALLALTAWRFGRPGASRLPLNVGAEAGAIVCLMLLLSPMSSKAHYVVLVLPCMLFARALIERRHATLRLLLPILLITGPLTSKGLTGKTLGDLTLAWGFPTWFALMLLAAMWLLLPGVWAKVSLEAEPERRPAERAA
jgi:hypothetical protein